MKLNRLFRPATPHARFRSHQTIYGSELEGELLHDKDGSSRFGTLVAVRRGKKRIWVADRKVYERATDGNYWHEVSTTHVDTESGKSIRTVQGGAPGLGKKS